MISRDRLRQGYLHARRRVWWVRPPWVVRCGADYTPNAEEIYLHHLCRRRETTAPCSCAGCGNPRRHAKGADRMTNQERRAAGAGRRRR